MDGAAQSRFDLRIALARSKAGVWQARHSIDTTALKAHLLPSRSPLAASRKKVLLEVPCSLLTFYSGPGAGMQHVFSDGSATSAQQPFGIAAWGSLNASTGELISLGYVPGLCQATDRAELLAVLTAIEWQCCHQLVMHLWIDSKFVADGYLSLKTWVCWRLDPHDLWVRIEQLLPQVGQNELALHCMPI
eukprot:s321_g18.t1